MAIKYDFHNTDFLANLHQLAVYFDESHYFIFFVGHKFSGDDFPNNFYSLGLHLFEFTEPKYADLCCAIWCKTVEFMFY